MKSIKQIYEEVLKTRISTDNFTNVIGEDDIIKTKIMIEDNFLDDGILSLYKVGASKYELTFNVVNEEKLLGELYGKSIDIIKFLIDVLELSYDTAKERFPKLDFQEYDKLNT